MKRGIVIFMALTLALAFGVATWARPVAETDADGRGVRPGHERLEARMASLLAQTEAAGVRADLPTAWTGWGDLFTEGFEGAFPGTRWALDGNPTWGKTAYRRYAGSSSAWIFAGGSAAVLPPGPYPTNKRAVMMSGPYDLRQVSDAEIAFHHWTLSENTNDTTNDPLCVMASTGGDFYGDCYYGNFTTLPGNVQGWVPGTFDLTDVYYLGNLTGRQRVWIAFLFKSNASKQFEGSYVDDVALRVYTGPTPTPTATATPASACPGASMSSYLTTNDNENNALTGQPDNDMSGPDVPFCIFGPEPKAPIEFRIFANNPPGVINTARLNLRVFDVDEQEPTCAEVDTVKFNGNSVGTLTGADFQWSTTSLDIAPGLVQAGGNLVQVAINTLNCPNPANPDDPKGRWCMAVDWGELVLEGGQGAASIRESSTDVSCYVPGSTIHLEVEADTTLASQEVRVEANVLDAAAVNLVGRTETKTIHAAQDDAFLVDLLLPEGAPLGEHRLQIILTDSCSETQNAYQERALVIGPLCGTPSPTPTATPTPSLTPSPTATATGGAAVRLFVPLVMRPAP